MNVDFPEAVRQRCRFPAEADAARFGGGNALGNNQFAPDKAITREEMAVMIYNYAKVTNYTLPASRAAVTFTDDAQISSWAKDAVKALQQSGIVSGIGGGKFNPKGTATRAEAATILRNFVESVIDESAAMG